MKRDQNLLENQSCLCKFEKKKYNKAHSLTLLTGSTYNIHKHHTIVNIPIISNQCYQSIGVLDSGVQTKENKRVIPHVHYSTRIFTVYCYS